MTDHVHQGSRIPMNLPPIELPAAGLSECGRFGSRHVQLGEEYGRAFYWVPFQRDQARHLAAEGELDLILHADDALAGPYHTLVLRERLRILLLALERSSD